MVRMVWYGDKIMRRIERQAPPLRHCLAEKVVKIARRLVAVKSGALKRTIRAEGGVVIAGSDEVDYAGAVELGGPKRAAQPFLRPATEQLTKDDLEKCIK